MREPIHVLKGIQQKAIDKTYKFQRLYRNLYNPEFYLLAYQNIAKSQGSMTAGADGITLDGMSMARIEAIIASIKDRSYQPKPARRTYIMKKTAKSVRWASPPQMTGWWKKSCVCCLKPSMNRHFPNTLTDSDPTAAATQR